MAGRPRSASKAPFPYGTPGTDRVLYFVIDEVDCLPLQIRATTELIAAIQNREQIYAAWPGKERTDLFKIDEPELLLESLNGRT
jgi:hypothetical protein